MSISGGDISGLPLKVNSSGDLVYTNPSGTEQIIASSTELPRIKSYSFESFSGSSGINYVAGFYDLTAADVNLSQGSATGTLGAANITHAAHALLVAKQAGTVGGGASGNGVITLTGTSITDAGVRNASASEVIVADTTAMSANEYFESALKWIGQVTYTLTQDGDRTTYAADFNVGFAKYDDWASHDFTITKFEAVGLGGANDSGFDVALMEHVSANWIYHASAFVAPVSNDICRMTTDHSTESELGNGQDFAYKRDNLSTAIVGTAAAPTTTVPNGYLIQITTGANGAVQDLDAHVGVKLT